MKAYASDAFGEPGSVREVELEEPPAGQVRVKTVAAGLNPVDWNVGLGYLKDYLEHKFPLVLGQDLSGIVDAVGPGVEGLQIGDEVFGGPGQPHMGRGTFAEYVIAFPRSLAAKPDDLDHVEASAIPLAGVTALMSVDALGEIDGQPIVVIGAAGGVGSFVVQIARERGAHVIGTARAANHEYLRSLGVDEAIDYSTTDVAETIRRAHPVGIAGVIHLAGDAPELEPIVRLVKDGGTVATPRMVPPMEAGRVNWVMITADVTGERLAHLLSLRQDGALKLPPTTRFALTEVTDALKTSSEGHVRGKLAILVDQNA